MNTVNTGNTVNTDLKRADAPVPGNVVSAPFFLRGELVEGQDVIHRSRDLGVAFATPRISLDRVVHPRTQVPPLLNVPLAEIIELRRRLPRATPGRSIWTCASRSTCW